MRLTFSTQSDARTRADSIHQEMIAADPDYAASVAAGQTTKWATPYQDYNYDAQGNPTMLIGTSWYVTVDSRCRQVLTATEQTEAGFFS